MYCIIIIHAKPKDIFMPAANN
ncbi:DUF1778 domain-containing protein, partial [Escherichia coli]